METKNKFDSTLQTDYHRIAVYVIFATMILPVLYKKALLHDRSKIQEPEKSHYDKFIPLLRTAKYGTPEYEEIRKQMREEGGDHHNKNNRHHPEYFGEKGITGMNLLDLMEMVVDWFAASLLSDTSFLDGLEGNCKKYGIPDELKQIIINTYDNANGGFKFFEEFIKEEDPEKKWPKYKRMTDIVDSHTGGLFGLYNEDDRSTIYHLLDYLDIKKREF